MAGVEVLTDRIAAPHRPQQPAARVGTAPATGGGGSDLRHRNGTAARAGDQERVAGDDVRSREAVGVDYRLRGDAVLGCQRVQGVCRSDHYDQAIYRRDDQALAYAERFRIGKTLAVGPVEACQADTEFGGDGPEVVAGRDLVGTDDAGAARADFGTGEGVGDGDVARVVGEPGARGGVERRWRDDAAVGAAGVGDGAAVVETGDDDPRAIGGSGAAVGGADGR